MAPVTVTAPFLAILKESSRRWRREIMNIHLKLYGSLRDHLPESDHGQTTLELEEGSMAGDVIPLLHLPQAVHFAVNDETAGHSTLLQPDDNLSVFGVMSGG